MSESYYLAFSAGFFVGAALNIPIGPNGALAVYRSSIYGWKAVLPTALGATIASGFYIFLGAIFASNPYLSKISTSPIFHVFGAIFLGLLAVFLYRKSHHLAKVERLEISPPSKRSLLLSAFAVGMTNPKSIVGFPAALLSSGFKLDESDLVASASLVTLGGVASSLLWWVVFVLMSRRFSASDNSRNVAKITRFLAYFIGVFAFMRFLKVFI